MIKCGWGPSELHSPLQVRAACDEHGGERTRGTYCQNVSGSSSVRHSGPKPNLKDDTDHLARCPMSGHSRRGGNLPVCNVRCSQKTSIWVRGESGRRGRWLGGPRMGTDLDA